MNLNEKKLLEKGWSEEEIEDARKILTKARANRKKKHIIHERATYWILLALLIGGAFVAAWLTIPFIIVLSTLGAAISMAIIGGLYGTLASILIADLEHLGTHHHVFLSIIIPVVTVLMSIFIYNQIVFLSTLGVIEINHNPFILEAAFASAALIPYIIFLVRK